MQNMARKLDSKHFQLISSRVEGTFEYQVYRVYYPGSTIILQSEEFPDQPIAAISFNTFNDDEMNERIPSLTVRRKEGLFQCVTGTSGNDVQVSERLEFVISNLTDFLVDPYCDINSHFSKESVGYLKIDLLTEDMVVSEVDLPNKAINQINELRPSESCVIKSDQRYGNFTMNLKKMMKTDNRGMERPVTVEQSEKDDFVKESTFNLFVNIMSKKNFPKMLDLLKNSKWMSRDVFVRKIPKNNGKTKPLFTCGPPLVTVPKGGPKMGIMGRSVTKGEGTESLGTSTSRCAIVPQCAMVHQFPGDSESISSS